MLTKEILAILATLLRASKLKMGYVTLTTPFLGVVCRLWLEFDTFHLCAKFDYFSLNRSRDRIGRVDQNDRGER